MSFEILKSSITTSNSRVNQSQHCILGMKWYNEVSNAATICHRRQASVQSRIMFTSELTSFTGIALVLADVLTVLLLQLV